MSSLHLAPAVNRQLSFVSPFVCSSASCSSASVVLRNSLLPFLCHLCPVFVWPSLCYTVLCLCLGFVFVRVFVFSFSCLLFLFVLFCSVLFWFLFVYFPFFLLCFLLLRSVCFCPLPFLVSSLICSSVSPLLSSPLLSSPLLFSLLSSPSHDKHSLGGPAPVSGQRRRVVANLHRGLQVQAGGSPGIPKLIT